MQNVEKRMSEHVVLVVESDCATESEQFLARELERVGYEVIEAHNLNVAAALLFIDRRINAVVIDAASEQVFPKLARGVSGILSCLCWKWRKRSSGKIAERTYEERTEALQRRRESSDLEAASFGPGASLGPV
jgi:hypothetical protein